MSDLKRAAISELLSVFELPSTTEETRRVIAARVRVLMRTTRPSEPWCLTDAAIQEILRACAAL
jgi:hypothetical protein